MTSLQMSAVSISNPSPENITPSTSDIIDILKSTLQDTYYWELKSEFQNEKYINNKNSNLVLLLLLDGVKNKDSALTKNLKTILFKNNPNAQQVYNLTTQLIEASLFLNEAEINKIKKKLASKQTLCNSLSNEEEIMFQKVISHLVRYKGAYSKALSKFNWPCSKVE